MTSYVGKIIRILDEFTIIIDAGDFSVSAGDAVQIYESSEPIVDLDGADLGEYVFIKDELQVIQVEEHYSVCKKNKTVTKASSMALALSPLLERTYAEKIPLHVNPEELAPIPTIDKTIHVGDKVRKKEKENA